MTTQTEALNLIHEQLQKLWLLGDKAAELANPALDAIKALAQPQTVNQFHPDYADEAINEMTLTIQRQSQRIEELEQEASGQYMTGYEVARSEFQQRIQELEAQGAQPEQEPVAIQYASRAERDLYEMEDEDDTTPPPVTEPHKRTWDGLTDEERKTISEANNMLVDDDLFDAIEAKLKEKNNG